MNNYKKEWAEIDQLRQQQLPQSMQPKVDAIYRSALAEKNYEQMLKAIIFQLNCIGSLREDDEGANLIFNTLKKDAETLPQPSKSIVYSMIGHMYREYYTRNSATINNRTTALIEQTDVRAMDGRSITEEAIKYYKLSLQDAESLQNEPIERYNAILLQNKDVSYQPTLYDLLANRALNFYSNQLNRLSIPQQTFVANDPDYFADARIFADIDIRTEDTLSFQYLSLRTYQDLLRFHLEKSGFGAAESKADDDISALIEVDLRRLTYLRSNGVLGNNDRRYEAALVNLSKTCQAYDLNANILYRLADFYFNQGEKWSAQKIDDYKSGYVRALEICERIEKEYPKQIGEHVKMLKQKILNNVLIVKTESVQLPGQPFLALLEFRNVDTVYQTVLQLTQAQALKYEADSRNFSRDTAIVAFAKSLKDINIHRQTKLPATTDYQKYTTEIKISPLDDGFYLIVLSDAQDWLNSSTVYTTAMVQVSPLMAQDRAVDNTMQVLVTDRKTGKPVSEAKISLYENEKPGSALFSDKDGIATRKLPEGNYITRYHVNDGKRQLVVFSRVYGRMHYEHDEAHAATFTDRSIYRPGQIVYYKAILYKKPVNRDYKLLPGETVRVQFRDVNDQVVSEQKLTSNEFGSVDGSFTIPQGLLNGQMSIDFDGYGRSYFRVEEYKRPTFEVKFLPVDGVFALNETVKVTANAKALAGYAIDQAQVQYRVTRSESFRYYFGFYPPTRNTREISSGSLKTDENGDVSIEFKALADDVADDRKIYTFLVTTDVTDVNGETRSASVDVRVANKPFVVSANLPDRLLQGKTEQFAVETANLNGAFIPATVKVELALLKSPGTAGKALRRRIWDDDIDLPTIPENDFRKDFPIDAYYNDSNPYQYDVLQTVADYTIATADNKKLDFSALKRSGHYRLKLTADNHQGVVADYVCYFYFSVNKPEAIANMSQWLTQVNTKGEPGEQAEFLVAGGDKESSVYFEVIHQSKVVEAKWIKTGMIPQKVTFPIQEAHRGGFAVQISMVQNNRIYSSLSPVNVPFTNKELNVQLATFRNQLLPGESETWTMQVSNRKGEKEMAEIVASLYDASLDALNPHDWSVVGIYPTGLYSYLYQWNKAAIQRLSQQLFVNRTQINYFLPNLVNGKSYADINWFDATYRMAFEAYRPMMMRSMVAAAPGNIVYESMADYEVNASGEYRRFSVNEPTSNGDVIELVNNTGAETPPTEMDLTAVATRTNFNETAFFYPALRTNKNGEVLIEFTMPEALTRWKLLSVAHTRDFKIGEYTNELITQKQVAISANPPRFFRENDVIELTAKVNNLTESDLTGQALLRLYDAVTMEPVRVIASPSSVIASPSSVIARNEAIQQSESTQPFDVKTGGSVGLRWRLIIPEGIQAITYKITAQAGTHTDGEEKTVPVLTNSMLVTETLPFSVRAGKEKSLTFTRLVNNTSTTLRHHSLTLEYTSAPAWYAVQAMPYIMEYPYECAEQSFSRYYANSLATTIVNKTPRIQQIFNLWNMQESQALLSNLEKNQELKQVMLEETPWVVQAKNESERKKRIGLLFDLNRMSAEMNRAFAKFSKAQNGDGGFPWFEGNPSNRYITQHIIAGLAHLQKLGALPDKHADEAQTIVEKGLGYLDNCIENDYDKLVKQKSDLEKQHIGSSQLHYLYACSFSAHRPEGKHKTSFDYYLLQAGKYWGNFSTYDKALAALVLHRYNQPEKAKAIIRSLKEHAQQSDEMGMYWKDNVAGYFWYQAPIETQAMLIEAFNEVTHDGAAVEEMKIWLLRNKQTNDWKTTKATSEAVYALLMTGGSLLDESKLLEVELTGKPLQEVAIDPIKPEPGTGYVKTSWPGSDVTPQMGRLKVKNPNSKGIAWGGMYWQYFEQLDKITSAETNLRMNKQLFLRTLTDKGEVLQPIDATNRLKVGDLVRVRMELRADRDYEYVHLKDMRASGFEPVSTVSGHRYQDGLFYYESVKDASTNFFITHLYKGTYVFEYDLRVTHAGSFSNGVTTFQCMYAPEFSAHSEGIRVSAE